MKTVIVIPAYNEEKKIGQVLDDLKKHKYRHIIVVDDGSSDTTYDVAEKHGATVLQHIINRGQGAALQTGIDYALSIDADIIVTFDADGQFLVEEIKRVVKPVREKKVDVVFGSRFLGKAVDIPFLKKIVLKMGVIVVFILYQIKVTDSQAGFRALSRKAAQSIQIRADKMEHAGEIFGEVTRHNLKYREVPITVIYDSYSKGKGQDWTRSLDLGIKMLIRRFFN